MKKMLTVERESVNLGKKNLKGVTKMGKLQTPLSLI
jgi:hypothetical protein